MNRKELYTKVKSMKLEAEIKQFFGDNYTRVSNANLEAFIAKKSCKKNAAKKTAKCTAKNEPFDAEKAIVRLVSTLQAGCVINNEDAQFILLGK